MLHIIVMLMTSVFALASSEPEPIASTFSATKIVEKSIAKIGSLDTLRFEVDIQNRETNDAGESRDHHYKVMVDWSRDGPSRTEVLDLNQSGKRIAAYEDDQELSRSPEAVGCFFASFKRSWLGDPSVIFGQALPIEGKVERLESFYGRSCYVLTRLISPGEIYRGQPHWVKLSYFIDVEDYLPRGRRTENCLGESWQDCEMWRTLESHYDYAELTERDYDEQKKVDVQLGSGAVSGVDGAGR